MSRKDKMNNKLFVNFALIVLIAMSTGACATAQVGKILAKGSTPNQGLMEGALTCSQAGDKQAQEACLVGVRAAAEVAIKNGESAARTTQKIVIVPMNNRSTSSSGNWSTWGLGGGNTATYRFGGSRGGGGNGGSNIRPIEQPPAARYKLPAPPPAPKQ